MKEESKGCDFCPLQLECANIATALRILEAKIPEVRNPALQNRFYELNQRIGSHGYTYPEASPTCELRNNPGLTHALVEELQKLIRDVIA